MEPPECSFFMLPCKQGLRVLNLHRHFVLMTYLRHSPQRGQRTSTKWWCGESRAPVSGLTLFSCLAHRAHLWQVSWFSQSSPPCPVCERFVSPPPQLDLCSFPGQFPLLSPLVSFELFLRDFSHLS